MTDTLSPARPMRPGRDSRPSAERPERSVLLIEDDPDMQSKLARMLKRQGARVIGTSSGEAALALIRQWRADLVLIDDGLPGLDGIEVARRIREERPETPVVMMSGRDSADLRLAAKLAGALETVAKPFGLDVLLDLLSRVWTEWGEPTPAAEG